MDTPSVTHSVPQAVLTKLGDVLASYALVEQSLKHLVGALVSADDHIGAVVTTEVPTKVLPMMARSLYRVHFGEDDQLSDLLALMKRVASAEQERNQIAHSHWDGFGSPLLDEAVLPAGSVIRLKIRALDGLEWKRQALSASDLDMMARRMDDLARDLLEFWRFNVNRARRRFAQHIAETVPANEIVPRTTKR